MREIKFRAWDNHDKKMCYDLIICNDGGENRYWWFGEWYFENRDSSHSFDNMGKGNVLMQYTGLKDKNGKEIFEGDIVKNIWFNVHKEDIGDIWEVKFGDYDNSEIEYGSRAYGFYAETEKGYKNQEGINNLPCDKGGETGTEGIEVIGNIYENTELLKCG